MVLVGIAAVDIHSIALSNPKAYSGNFHISVLSESLYFRIGIGIPRIFMKISASSFPEVSPFLELTVTGEVNTGTGIGAVI